MTSGRTTHRRQFLAGLATASGIAVAGCAGSLPWSRDETTGTVAAGDVAGVVTDDRLPIEWPVPVEPSKGFLGDAVERVDELLVPVPEPLTAADVPNGVVRESITNHRADAIGVRDEVGEAAGYHTLRNLRRARADARHARITFGAIDADTEALVADLRAERYDADATVRERLEAIEYVGAGTLDGRLRAALYSRQREGDLVRVERVLDRWSVRATDTVIDLGEAGSELEYAAATASVWGHLEDRYDADTTDEDVVDLEASFADALDRSLARVDAVDFPDQGGDDWYAAVGAGDVDDQVLEFALWRAGRAVSDAADRMETASAAGHLGSGLYHAVQFEQSYRAFEAFRDRIVDGSFSWPATVPEIRAERAAAIDAAGSVRETISGPLPGTLVLAETLQSLEWVDERVQRAADHDPETHVSLSDEYREYARRRAELSVLPEAVEAARDRLLAD